MSKIKFAWLMVKGFLTPGSSAFEAVVEYALKLLNNFLAGEAVSTKLKEGLRIAGLVLDVLNHFADKCPEGWKKYYNVILSVVQDMYSAFGDGELTVEEVTALRERFQIAYATWLAD